MFFRFTLFILFAFLSLPLGAKEKTWQNHSLGNPKAKVQILEFSSLSCHHCGHFHQNTFGSIKTQLIDTGQVYWRYYDFPLNPSAYAGSLASQCINKEQFFPYVSLLFKTQSQWVLSKNPMKTILSISYFSGFPKSILEPCTKNPDLLKAAQSHRNAIEKKYNITATPTFWVIGPHGKIKITGSKPLQTFIDAVDDVQ